jgi:hypothetical protein
MQLLPFMPSYRMQQRGEIASQPIERKLHLPIPATSTVVVLATGAFRLVSPTDLYSEGAHEFAQKSMMGRFRLSLVNAIQSVRQRTTVVEAHRSDASEHRQLFPCANLHKEASKLCGTRHLFASSCQSQSPGCSFWCWLSDVQSVLCC